MLRPLVSLLVLAAAAAPAFAAPYKPPRTPDGQPDLQGVWTNTAITFLQRPPNFKALELTEDEVAKFEAGFKKMVEPLVGNAPIDPNLPAPPEVKEVQNADFIEMQLAAARIDGKARSSWVVEPADGRIPFTEAGKALRKELGGDRSFDSYENRPLDERCLIAIGSPEGPPMMNPGFNGHYRIVQTRDHVAIEIEMNHDVRIIRLADKARPAAAVRSWLGDSVGRWEGETLVVETTNLRPHGYIYTMGGGFAYGPKAKVIERFTRTAEDVILYGFSVEDSDHFGPWRAEMPWRPAKGPIYEYACHEGNYSLENILAGARVEEQAPKAQPAR